MRGLSYANVAATLALVVALGGTAYAAGLPKDSVRSKHIKNNAVKSVDIKDSGLTGVDLADGSVKGADIDEATLSQVPDAATLAGVPATGYRKAPESLVGAVMDGTPLTTTIPGYGTFGASCDDNSTPAANDDLAQILYFPSVSAFSGGASTTQVVVVDGTGGPGDVDIAASTTAVQGSTGSGQYVHHDYVVRRTDGTKTLHMRAWGWDDPTTIGCFAQLDIELVR